MRILVDTNILFSALVFPRSRPAQALLYAAQEQVHIALQKVGLPSHVDQIECFEVTCMFRFAVYLFRIQTV